MFNHIPASNLYTNQECFPLLNYAKNLLVGFPFHPTFIFFQHRISKASKFQDIVGIFQLFQVPLIITVSPSCST